MRHPSMDFVHHIKLIGREKAWFFVAGLMSLNLVVWLLLAIWLPGSFDALIQWFKGQVVYFNLKALFVYLCILTTCMAVEAIVLGWKESSLAKLLRFSNSAKTDFFIAFMYILGFGTTISILSILGSYIVMYDLLTQTMGLNLLRKIPSPFVQYIVLLIVIDFLDYWYHRFMHKVKFLWQVHKYHHAATEFTMITGNRIHALERGFGYLFHCIPLVIIGSSVADYVVVRTLRTVVDIFQHSMVNWDFGWIGRWILFSPVGHRIHHSVMPEHIDKNFGNIIPIWDRLFGTWYDGTRINETVDVGNNPYNQSGVFEEFIMTYKLTLKSLWTSYKTGKWTFSKKKLRS